MSIETVLNFVASPEFMMWRRAIIILAVLLLTILVAVTTNYFMRRSFTLFRHYRHAEHMPGRDKTKFVFARRLVVVLIYMIGIGVIIYLIPELRAISYSIFAGAGLLAIVVGFAAQKAFANIMSGLFLAVSQPIRVGDRVTIKNYYGTVEDITLRHTVIQTWDDNRVILPNSMMNETEILNHSIMDEAFLQTLEIGIGYDADLDKAKQIMTDLVFKHPAFTPIQREGDYLPATEIAKVRVMALGEYSLRLKLYFWAKDKPTGFVMSCDLLESTKKAFDKEGIEIPYPYRNIVNKNIVRKQGKKTIKKKSVKKAVKKKRP